MGQVHFSSFTAKPGGRDCLSFSAFSFFVCDDQSIKIPAASNFKLHIILILLDLDGFGVLSPSRQQEVLDFLDFVRHAYMGVGGSTQLALAETLTAGGPPPKFF